MREIETEKQTKVETNRGIHTKDKGRTQRQGEGRGKGGGQVDLETIG